MKEFKGTKGPWEISIVHGVCIGVEADLDSGYSQMIVNTILPDTDKAYAKEKKEIIANAKLIAAAPELLDALEYLLDSLNSYDENDPDAIKKARQAISKALD